MSGNFRHVDHAFAAETGQLVDDIAGGHLPRHESAINLLGHNKHCFLIERPAVATV